MGADCGKQHAHLVHEPVVFTPGKPAACKSKPHAVPLAHQYFCTNCGLHVFPFQICPACGASVGASSVGSDGRPSAGSGEALTTSSRENIMEACMYGSQCYRKNLNHLREYVHPGDRNYRLGMVRFPKRKGVQMKPEFQTLRDLFNYCDPDESGNISKDEFEAAWALLSALPEEMLPEGEESTLTGSVGDAWELAAGENTHLTFAQFAKFASISKLKLPVGIDLSDGAPRKCCFQYARRCPCVSFTPSEQANVCICGHKSSAHMSDIAQMTLEEQEVLNRLKRSSTVGKSVLAAGARKPGFTMVTKKEVLNDLQRLLDATHKAENNWTRDRGCALHGRNGCESRCVFAHRAPVPTGYTLVRAEQNRNPALYQNYETTRAAIRDECQSGAVEFQQVEALSALDIVGQEPLWRSSNEWRLLHGTGLPGCRGICSTGFRLKMAGTGATWKDAGSDKGKPLYGYGVYLAESITKADEYAEVITGGLPTDEGCYSAVVCRVIGGLCRVVDTNEFDTDELRRDVFDGPYHSVLGDRVAKLGKPYREVVVYNSVQIFPEFILYYERTF